MPIKNVPARGLAVQPALVVPTPVAAVPPKIQIWGWAIIIGVVIFAIVFSWIRSRKFAKDYAALSARLDGYFGKRTESALSPGHTYMVASRGPSHAREAEMQSADARWRHLSMAFPHLGDRGEKRPLILVSRTYTDVTQVNEMQDWVGARISSHASSRGRDVLKPIWIQQLGEDFDALRHPELAIANPCIYTFPFFLTWQRRHQWGVLPYAVHNRLGVVCHPEHSQSKMLLQIQREYADYLNRAKNERTALWVNDPKHARWLPLIMEAAGSISVSIDRSVNAAPLAQQHTSDTVFSVGAYLHKEILPLICAIIPDPRAGSTFAEFARELEVSDLRSGFIPSKVDEFPRNSAVIADLAVLPAQLEKAGWLVFRLPHCVYVPIGIGYSVAAVPLLLEDSVWRNDLLRDVGSVLVPAAAKLADLGIELDNRLWMADSGNGG